MHTGSEAKRDPRKPVQKMLYLIFVKDLTCWDDDLQRRSFGLNNRMTFFKDSLTSHFYRMVLEHHELKMTEHNHTSLCSCKVQMDSNQQVHAFIKTVYTALHNQDPERFDLKKMEENILELFAYLLEIKDDLKMKE